MSEQRRIHHIGVKVPDMATYQLIVRVLSSIGMRSIEAPPADGSHERTYFELVNSEGNLTGIYCEIQCWKDGQWGIHVDVIAGDPAAAAEAIARVAGTKVISLEGEPQTLVSVAGIFTIMFRSAAGGRWRPGED